MPLVALLVRHAYGPWGVCGKWFRCAGLESSDSQGIRNQQFYMKIGIVNKPSNANVNILAYIMGNYYLKCTLLPTLLCCSWLDVD